MTVRAKAVALVAAILVVGLIAIHLVSHVVLIPSYASLEARFVHADLQRTLSAIETRLYSLDATCHDWASWDDMYDYVETRSAAFAASTLVDSAFETLGLNVIAIYDAERRPVFIQAIDLASGAPIDAPAALLAHLGQDSRLLGHVLSGIGAGGAVCLPDGPVLFSARPILGSGDEGPVRGVLVMAAFFDEMATQQIRDVTYLPVSVAAIGQSLTDRPVATRDSFAEAASVSVTPLNAASISAQAIVADVYGEPVLRVSFVRERDIYAEAQHTITFFLAVLAAGGLLLALLALWLVDRTIFRRLARLAAEVRSIGEQTDFRGAVSISGDDEISFLAGTINETLEALAQSHQQLHASHAELEQTARDLRRTQQELGATANRLRRLTRHLQSLREDERAVVANEIHDQVGQGLTALKLDLSVLEKESAAGRIPSAALLARTNEVVNMLQDTVRRLSTGLRPSMVEDLGLAEALEWHLGEFAKGRAVGTTLRVQGPIGGVEAGRAMTIFRILQEALLVVAEDPSVTRVAVTLTVESRYALLAIEDNGVADLTGDALSRRDMGLSLIRERVEVFGGGVTIASAPESGTTVVAQVPL